MKYIIFNTEGKKIGSYEGDLDETSEKRSYLMCPPFAYHVQLPEGLDEECIKLNISSDPAIPHSIVEDAELVAYKQKVIKDAKISELYENMNNEVLAEMAKVFGTSNPNSASAYLDTWKLMVEKPQLFVGKLGLTDEASIISYAQSKIAVAEQYAIFRLERISKFQFDRSLIS